MIYIVFVLFYGIMMTNTNVLIENGQRPHNMFINPQGAIITFV